MLQLTFNLYLTFHERPQFWLYVISEQIMTAISINVDNETFVFIFIVVIMSSHTCCMTIPSMYGYYGGQTFYNIYTSAMILNDISRECYASLTHSYSRYKITDSIFNSNNLGFEQYLQIPTSSNFIWFKRHILHFTS